MMRSPPPLKGLVIVGISEGTDQIDVHDREDVGSDALGGGYTAWLEYASDPTQKKR